MSVILTRDALARLFPNARPEIRAALDRSQSQALARFGITASKRRLAFFLAQAAEESGGFARFTENLSYTAERMRQVWPQRFASLGAAKPYERNPEKLADKVYGGRMGNGPEGSGDGWRYRGRGPIQLTGKANYREIGALVGLDLLADPDLAAAPGEMMLVCAGYWAKHDLNRFADAADFVGLTRAINGGTTNLALRRDWLRKVEAELARPDALATAASAPEPAEARPVAPLPSPSPLPGGVVTTLLRWLSRQLRRAA